MTRRQILSFVVLVSFFITAACGNEPTQPAPPANSGSPATPAPAPDPFAAVRVTYDKECKECHAQNGAGGPVKLADGTRLKVPTLREGNALRHKDSDFEKQITKGGDGMPAFGEKMKPEEISEMIRFIRREFQGGAAPAK